MVSKRHRRGLPAAPVFLAIFAFAGLLITPGLAARGVRSTHDAVTRTTQLRWVTPVTSTGRLASGYTVTATGRGYCWTSSFMHGRAYRCFEDNFILDPCWRQPQGAAVICLLEPWSHAVTRLKLTRRLPPGAAYGPALWGLRVDTTSGPVNCLLATGAGGFVGGRHISYYCRHRWVLLGTADHTGPLWSIGVARKEHGHYLVQGEAPVRIAWRPTVPTSR